MLSLAIVDDIGAILVVAIGYGSSIHWEALALAVVGLVVVRGMILIGIRVIAIYFLVGGLAWLSLDASGIHGTVTGVILGLMTPTGKWISDKRLHTVLNRVVAQLMVLSEDSSESLKDQGTTMNSIAMRERHSLQVSQSILNSPTIDL